MRRTTALRTTLAAVVVAGTAFAASTRGPAAGSPAVPAHGPTGVAQSGEPLAFSDTGRYEGRDVIVAFGIGKGPNKGSGSSFDVTVPLVSPTTGKVIGTVRHEPRCADDSVPCAVLIDKDTYDLGDGTVVAKGRVTFLQDPDRPGFALTSGQPTEKNIVEATGAYAGRTGEVRVYGYVDSRDFPNSFTLDEVYVIALDKK